MNEKQLLQKLGQFMKEEGFDSTLIEASEKAPWDLLLLYMGQDEKKRERLLEVVAKRQELGQGFKNGEKSYFHVSFGFKFPFLCQNSHLYDLGSAILWLNRSLDLPGFEMSELEGRPLYRYVLLCPEEVDKKMIMALCGAITLYLSLYSDLIENICTGTKSFNQTLQEILELVK